MWKAFPTIHYSRESYRSILDLQDYSLCLFNHCDPVIPYGMDLSQQQLRSRLVAWQNQAITWTNIDQSSVR